MTDKKYLFTSESVSEGHPDKVCDRISDMVVDSYLAKEPFARVACETLTTTNKVILAGEVRGPEIKNEEIIQKLSLIYIHNHPTLQWELIQKMTKTRELEIKVLCLGMHVLKQKN